jgi:hypothetical protein
MFSSFDVSSSTLFVVSPRRRDDGINGNNGTNRKVYRL